MFVTWGLKKLLQLVSLATNMDSDFFLLVFGLDHLLLLKVKEFH